MQPPLPDQPCPSAYHCEHCHQSIQNLPHHAADTAAGAAAESAAAIGMGTDTAVIHVAVVVAAVGVGSAMS